MSPALSICISTFAGFLIGGLCHKATQLKPGEAPTKTSIACCTLGALTAAICFGVGTEATHKEMGASTLIASLISPAIFLAIWKTKNLIQFRKRRSPLRNILTNTKRKNSFAKIQSGVSAIEAAKKKRNAR